MAGDVPSLIVNVIAKPGSIHHGQRNTDALLFELCEPHTALPSATFSLASAEKTPKKGRTDRDGLDLDSRLDVGHLGIHGRGMVEDVGFAESIDKGCSSRSRRSYRLQREGDGCEECQRMETRSDVPTTKSVS